MRLRMVRASAAYDSDSEYAMITCSVCNVTSDPSVRVGPLAICPNCGSSLVIEQNGTVRRAVATDTEPLSMQDLARLTAARAAIARPVRRR